MINIMSKVNNIVEKNIFARYSIILAGMIISSIGINGFIRPAHLLSGGVTKCIWWSFMWYRYRTYI